MPAAANDFNISTHVRHILGHSDGSTLRFHCSRLAGVTYVYGHGPGTRTCQMCEAKEREAIDNAAGGTDEAGELYSPTFVASFIEGDEPARIDLSGLTQLDDSGA